MCRLSLVIITSDDAHIVCLNIVDNAFGRSNRNAAAAAAAVAAAVDGDAGAARWVHG